MRECTLISIAIAAFALAPLEGNAADGRTETILTSTLAAIDQSQINYDLFLAGAQPWQEKLPKWSAFVHKLGPIQAISLRRTTSEAPVGHPGAPALLHDEYEVKYLGDVSYVWSIGLEKDGKISMLLFHRIGGDNHKYD